MFYSFQSPPMCKIILFMCNIYSAAFIGFFGFCTFSLFLHKSALFPIFLPLKGLNSSANQFVCPAVLHQSPDTLRNCPLAAEHMAAHIGCYFRHLYMVNLVGFHHSATSRPAVSPFFTHMIELLSINHNLLI